MSGNRPPEWCVITHGGDVQPYPCGITPRRATLDRLTDTGAAMDSTSSRRTRKLTTPQRKIPSMCQHKPPCPTADSADRQAAQPVAHHPEQGWSLLCNGVLLFEDTGELLPDGQIVGPQRPLGIEHVTAAA